MTEKSLSQIAEKLKNSPGISPEKRDEMLKLLARLKAEIGTLPPEQQAQTESILGFASVSTHEATRPVKNEKLLGLAVDGLSSSVAEFENSHPGLVKNINAICTALSNLGI